MRLRTPAAVTATAVLVIGGLGACSSSGTSSDPSSAASSAAPSVSATPNGIQDLKPDEILAQAKTAAESATSVKVKLVTEAQGQEILTDLTISSEGSQGTLGQPGGEPVQVVATPTAYYVKGGGFAERLGANEADVAGQWLSVPKDNPAAQTFAGLGSVKDFAASTLNAPSDMKKGDTKDINGVPAIGLTSKQATLWIATVGEPYPLLIEAPEGTKGSMTLSDWNAPVTITPPPEAEVVDITTLQSAAPQVPTAPAPSAPAPSAS